MAAEVNRKISAASARAHTRNTQKKGPIQLPSETKLGKPCPVVSIFCGGASRNNYIELHHILLPDFIAKELHGKKQIYIVGDFECCNDGFNRLWARGTYD